MRCRYRPAVATWGLIVSPNVVIMPHMTQHVIRPASHFPTLIDEIEQVAISLCQALRDQDHLEAVRLAEWIVSVRPGHALARATLEDAPSISGTFSIFGVQRAPSMTNELSVSDFLLEEDAS